MTDKKDSDSIEATKLQELCNIVLHRADSERNRIINDAQNEINHWINEQEAILIAECDSISKDSVKQADETTNSLIANAKSESSSERLKLQNKYIDAASAIFQSKLEALRNRRDYKEILAGLAIEAIEELPKGQDISFRLSAADSGLGEEIAAIIRKVLPVNITFDPTPGGFSGGVIISSADGRWNVVSDWRAKTVESEDAIATRVLAAL